MIHDNFFLNRLTTVSGALITKVSDRHVVCQNWANKFWNESDIIFFLIFFFYEDYRFTNDLKKNTITKKKYHVTYNIFFG